MQYIRNQAINGARYDVKSSMITIATANQTMVCIVTTIENFRDLCRAINGGDDVAVDWPDGCSYAFNLVDGTKARPVPTTVPGPGVRRTP